MKRTLWILLLLPIAADAHIKLSPHIAAGYFKDMARQSPASYSWGKTGHYGVADVSTTGFFAGLGLNAALPVLPIGFQLEAAYEKHSLNYYFYDDTRVNGRTRTVIFGAPYPPYPSSASYIKIAPSFTFNKFKRMGFSYGAELGAAYRLRISDRMPADNNYTNLCIALSAGYSGIVLRAGYEYGLTSVIKSKEADPTLTTYYGPIKSNRINIGIVIYPTVLLKG